MHETLEQLGSAPLYKRLLALIFFLALLVGFRHLALLFVTFIVMARGLGYLGARVGELTGQTARRGFVAVLLILLGLLGLGLWAGVHAGGRFYQKAIELGEGRPLTELLQAMQEDLIRRTPPWLPLEGMRHKVPELLDPAMTYVRATGRTLLQLLIGLILAVVYLLDREPVDALARGAPQDGVTGHLVRYLGYACEAVIITISLQVLVALINALLTLPVLALLGLPHKVAFTLLIFVASLVPVVGNLASGAVLIVASYIYRGPMAVVVFVVTTFILHKIEAYFLNPRLAARHVQLPALVLIISLILFEHMFGIIGLFLSFPALYVGLNVLHDLRRAVRQGRGASVALSPGEAAAQTASEAAAEPLPPVAAPAGPPVLPKHAPRPAPGRGKPSQKR